LANHEYGKRWERKSLSQRYERLTIRQAKVTCLSLTSAKAAGVPGIAERA
jgi:hypothetical protein